MSELAPGQAPFHLLTLGPFSRERVICTLTEDRMAHSEEVDRLIEQAWTDRSLQAKERGQLLYPGPMCRLSGWSVENGELRVTYGLTDYRELVGTNISHPGIGARFGDEYLSNGSGVCTTIETSDGRLILHRRNGRVFEYPGMLDTCGGALEPIESPDGPVADPFAMATREIEEELGIPAAMIAEMTCLGIARDGLTLKPEMLMRTRISLDSAEIPALPGDEHAQLMTVPGDPASLNTWLAEHWSEMAPASLACLVAHTACIFADGIASTWPSR